MNAGEWVGVVLAVLGSIGGAWKGLLMLLAAARADALKDRDLAKQELATERAEAKLLRSENATLVARIGVLERDLEDLAHEREKLLPFLPPQVRRAVETGFIPLDEAPHRT